VGEKKEVKKGRRQRYDTYKGKMEGEIIFLRDQICTYNKTHLLPGDRL